MYVTDVILLDYLRSLWTVKTFGKSLSGTELLPPAFYYSGQNTAAGGLYVARLSDLPAACREYCVFVCPGERLPDLQRCHGAVVFSVQNGGGDILSLFNAVQQYFSKVSAWAFRMQELLIRGGEMKEYVEASIPLFENGITITDYALNILVNCKAVEENGRKHLVMDDEFEQVPSYVSATFAQDFLASTANRTPFIFKGQLANPEGDNYCVNLYQGDTYIGCCTLYDCMRSMREADFRLFCVFADFIRRAIGRTTEYSDRSIVTLSSIFSSLLMSFPISSEDYNLAMRLLRHNMDMRGQIFGRWHCTVLRSANRSKVLPEQYLCTILEGMLPHTAAVYHEEQIVLFSAVPETETMEESVCDILLPYLKDMNFLAAVSAPFSDIYQARKYYRQAECVLELGCESENNSHLFFFQDFALTYLLKHASGEFAPELLLTPGLKALRESPASVDYWDTLCQYLENECNASETARQMYLHRSTLLTRLDKIREWVDLDDPESRLYLRIMTKILR